MPPRIQGWDPILIISQIVCLQSFHYLTLSFIIPPLLSVFAEPHALAHQGGAGSVGMIMDWREMAGRATITGMEGDDSRGWSAFRGVWSGGKRLGGGSVLQGWEWEGGTDPSRGWIIGLCWLLASGADVLYIYHIVRKPTHVLDFALTLLLNHLILTTYYSSSLPSSLFFWLVVFGGSAITIIFAEQLCVRREMKEGLGTDYTQLQDVQRNHDAEEGRVIPQGSD
ncbi:hypothetical protein FRC04_008051 [Tulasnella sp. 424]|nr:hypothetical protein FRC04_008051 [Tulasnella sp. 424]KAG8974711.1 hypothetical protein FRC05_006871 [Tulasnella sp. 425]